MAKVAIYCPPGYLIKLPVFMFLLFSSITKWKLLHVTLNDTVPSNICRKWLTCIFLQWAKIVSSRFGKCILENYWRTKCHFGYTMGSSMIYTLQNIFLSTFQKDAFYEVRRNILGECILIAPLWAEVI